MSNSILSSSGVVLATAMAVSGTVIFLALRREKNFPGNQDSHPTTEQIPRSCLSSSEGKKRETKKKRVQFAESVKDKSGNGEEYRKKELKKSKAAAAGIQRSCRGEIAGIPANRVALYSGILKDRVQRLECSF